MKKFCERCNKEVETKIITRTERYKVLGEEIQVEAQVIVCADCNEEIFSEKMDSETIDKAFNEYRRRHKLLYPHEIREIREMYDLSQRAFAKLLGWGDKTINRYENGAIQDEIHNDLLVILRDPEQMKKYIENVHSILSDKQFSHLLDTVNMLIKKEKPKYLNKLFNLYFEDDPLIENGFKSFDYEKFAAMAIYFASKDSILLKSKLMKLLHYADFIHFKESSNSISGSKYVHLAYGPVPVNFELLLEKFSSDGILHIEIEENKDYEKHKVVLDSRTYEDVLTKEEKMVLERVYEKFKLFGSREISKYSHKEKGYSSTELGEIISYQYALDMSFEEKSKSCV